MRSMPYFIATAIIFFAVAMLHLLRIILGWSALIGGWAVPVWLSWLAIAVSAVLVLYAITLLLGRAK